MAHMKPAVRKGGVHPITLVTSDFVTLFRSLGYAVETGPERETEEYNFDALNIPEHHPSREMWDTFWLRGHEGELLRTHTSPMQVRYMQRHDPPYRVIVPGKVFRNEATDRTHEVQFHQLEGFCVTENTTLADMQQTLSFMLQQLFGNAIDIRYRPSFFPFTEPSLEVDIKRPEDTDWLEILGCGMVHRHVLSRAGVDARRYQGFAFGVGVDRIAMLRYGLDDIRLLYSGDLRVVNQFCL
ncbi:MAG: phenylalanine--tRNA ligase subunit alpha [Candidatus Kaiserbacteria bacterium]|nr:phenylalanine--tRNA ligase subunit alpha [Candidatus Kaiserbacteria bacterium]